ncbi:hypothetical protein EIN_470070 [Entamoeba invadens IP1]|uniref:Uncharacterized protein n=1 Tax=Entamoeba invadens IP1 TaxID=370355 RepID=A0A0A1TWN9_ENTIV|nr:hypothetical protein EIN_470070 [Entamoeba invadens IP1]ELP83773.1 hypothetical protein EIN_470070 [Entamoeba invadens IP1]|eukprot:XP_004183119.1 hypothetical protein EIN_470070 [Entamoeba invadens IP1]
MDYTTIPNSIPMAENYNEMRQPPVITEQQFEDPTMSVPPPVAESVCEQSCPTRIDMGQQEQPVMPIHPPKASKCVLVFQKIAIGVFFIVFFFVLFVICFNAFSLLAL